MPTKVKQLRAPVESGSISDVVLHFLFMFNKTDVYEDPTSAQLYAMNPAKYKKKDNLDRALCRLIKMKLITSYLDTGDKRYKITQQGVDSIYKLAMYRRRHKKPNTKDDDDI